MIKLLLNVDITIIEALVVSGNKFWYACVKRSLPPVSSVTFWYLASTPHYCWSAVIPTSSSGRQQVVVIWSEIRVLRRVVKQLPVEMFQQCSSARSCTQMHIVMEEHYTEWHHSMHFVLNGPTQMFQCFVIHIWCYCGPLINEFHHQCSFPVPEKLPSAVWQCLFNFFGFFVKCVCIHYFTCSLVSKIINKTQVSSPVTCMMWLRNSLSSLWHHS
jgi:hypothetical protein